MSINQTQLLPTIHSRCKAIVTKTMSIQCKNQENDEDNITITSPYCTSTKMNRNCLELLEGHTQYHTNTCMAVEQPLNNTTIPNTIQVPRRDMKQHPIMQGEIAIDAYHHYLKEGACQTMHAYYNMFYISVFIISDHQSHEHLTPFVKILTAIISGENTLLSNVFLKKRKIYYYRNYCMIDDDEKKYP